MTILLACGDDSSADAGSDASGGDASPDTSMADGSMDGATDASGDGAMDASGDGAMDASGDGAMDSSAEDSSTDAPIFDALPDGSPADAIGDASRLRTGTAGCTSDSQCDEAVCWDFSDYDPLCGGTVCSLSCSDSSECVSAATAAGAPTPAAATCGSDGKCNLMSAGLGTFFCA